jgi:hypothetical protein
MAGLIHPDDFDLNNYYGLSEIFEFVNADGRFTRFNCGQAAACTFLTHHGKLKPIAETMPEVESDYPPDNLGGWLGTSRRRVEQVCRGFGVPTEAIEGEAELRLSLEQRRPVIVMLGVPGPKVLRFTMPMGHWMVAYGFDDENVYLSNHGCLTWDEFRGGWHGFVPWLIRMGNRGLVASEASPM